MSAVTLSTPSGLSARRCERSTNPIISFRELLPNPSSTHIFQSHRREEDEPRSTSASFTTHTLHSQSPPLTPSSNTMNKSVKTINTIEGGPTSASPLTPTRPLSSPVPLTFRPRRSHSRRPPHGSTSHLNVSATLRFLPSAIYSHVLIRTASLNNSTPPFSASLSPSLLRRIEYGRNGYQYSSLSSTNPMSSSTSTSSYLPNPDHQLAKLAGPLPSLPVSFPSPSLSVSSTSFGHPSSSFPASFDNGSVPPGLLPLRLFHKLLTVRHILCDPTFFLTFPTVISLPICCLLPFYSPLVYLIPPN